MREHDLRAASTFFESNKKYNTWRNPRDKRPHQIDHFLIPRNQLCHTVDVKRKLDSIDSDHAALCIEFRLSSETLLLKKTENSEEIRPKNRINNFLLRNSQKGEFQRKVSEFFLNLDLKTAAESTEDELLHIFESHITEAAKEAAEQPISSKPDWFSASEHILMELISKRNEAQKNFMKKGTPDLQETLKKTQTRPPQRKKKSQKEMAIRLRQKMKNVNRKTSEPILRKPGRWSANS
jgi:hypothetical protein